ncbi:hypothetical protein [Nonomuraea rhizosphaerae]|uniref:hypothetical protein n=1 Tax=Nonomuraea rhizosphaerae TaxID=2665663 RepID=UPI001C5D83C3|nr:hypothetical protein [Nonomuraea rhizosphaerae]
MWRPIASATVALSVLATGCTGLNNDDEDILRIHGSTNEGANADAKDMHIRNAFFLAGADSSQPMALYAVLVNQDTRDDQLQRISVTGGGTVQLTGPIGVPSKQPVGAQQPLAMLQGRSATGSVPVTFSFANVGDVRVQVSIKERKGPYASLTPSMSGSPTPAPNPTSPAPTTSSPSASPQG